MSDKKKFDKEYSTTYIKEKQYLDKCGVRYSFVKEVDRITIYKYKKTSELYECLSSFYKQFEDQKWRNIK